VRVYVTAPAGTHVEVDGERVVRWSDIDEQWQTAHVRLDAGPHRIEADHPVGAVVYGIDETVSYAYPAGAKLQPVPANP